MNFGLFMLWYWSAYVAVTLVAIGHTIFNWKVLKMENKKAKVSSMYDVVPSTPGPSLFIPFITS